MQKWISEGPSQQIATRLTSIGVDKQTAANFTSQDRVTARWESVRTGSRQKTTILFLPCVLDNAYLYVVVRNGDEWQATDSDTFDCHYDMNVSYEIKPIRKSTFDEVLIHHAGEGHGTGIVIQNFKVFGIDTGKLKQELNIQEVAKSFRIGEPKLDIILHSTFTVIPVSERQTLAIEETRSSLTNDHLVVQRRIFRWDSSAGRYLPSKFIKVEVPAS